MISHISTAVRSHKTYRFSGHGIEKKKPFSVIRVRGQFDKLCWAVILFLLRFANKQFTFLTQVVVACISNLMRTL